jgi:hypothetical protein
MNKKLKLVFTCGLFLSVMIGMVIMVHLFIRREPQINPSYSWGIEQSQSQTGSNQVDPYQGQGPGKGQVEPLYAQGSGQAGGNLIVTLNQSRTSSSQVNPCPGQGLSVTLGQSRIIPNLPAQCINSPHPQIQGDNPFGPFNPSFRYQNPCIRSSSIIQ